ncbi:tyrosine-type recombinase/integrase [Thiocapsa bogorovii]|nr:tyrosine-type recombinase/integrase [Thiocapsa bogorovii]
MTRSNVNKRLELAVARAAERYPSLNTRHISPHSVRHSTAMHMLQSGVAFSVIALWLGHESMTTTHRYVEADLAMKQNALARLQEPAMESTRYQPPDELMRFLLDL